MADLTKIQAIIDKRAASRLARELSSLRGTVIASLEGFGAETAAQKRELLERLLAGDDAATLAAALPWTLSDREAIEVESMRMKMGAIEQPE